MFVFKPQIDTSSLAQDEPAPSTFLETLEANTEILGSAFRNSGREEEAYDARNDAIFDRLGVKLENPARMAQGYQLGGIDWRGQYDQRLKDLQAQYPDASDIIRADLSPATEAAQQTAAVQQRAADTAARYPYRLPDNIPLVGGQSIPSMVGGLVTGATDPFTAPTLLIAPTRVAEGAAGVLWAGLRSGAANAIGSAAEQPYIAAWKKQAGLEHTFSDALKEVAANAAFGFLADVGVRGLYRGGQALAGRRPVLDDAGNVIGYRGATDPKADPLEALNDAAAAAPPGSILRKAAELDPDALREVARHTGLDADPAVRGALDALEQDRADLVPPAGVLDDEHIAKVNDAITSANDPSALPVGDAIVGGYGPDAPPERLREVLARDPIELAADIRETPEILAEGLPWTDPKLKAAAQLSKLSDQAFDMVAGGEVDPRLGTLVAEHVADPDQHAPLLRQLSEAAPATPEAARTKLADLLAGPRDEVAHARTAGIADELVDRPVTLVDDPYGADGMRQLEQLRRDLSAEIEAATGVKPNEAKPNADKSSPTPALSDGEISSIVDMWNFVREMGRQGQPERLSDFLRRRGGIANDAGEVSGILGGKRRSGGLINNRGLSLDDAALLAWEQGFFESADRPTINQFIDLLDRDLRGERVVRAADAERLDDLRVAREMEAELADLGVLDAGSEAELRAKLTDAQTEGRGRPEDRPAIAGGAEGQAGKENLTDTALAGKRDNPDDPLGKLQSDFDRIASAHDKLAEALDRAAGRLPEGVTAKSFSTLRDLPWKIARDVRTAENAGYRVLGMTDRQSGNIWVAADALDPDAILSHETIHALRQLGLLTDNELKLLAQKAEEFADVVAQYTPGSVDKEAYRRLYGENADEYLMQEAAAHLYEARANGANFGKEANAILRKIKQFLERAKNYLNGLGWQTAEDVMRAIDNGTVAGRAMRSADTGGALFSLRDDAQAQLKEDLAQVAAIADAKAKAQRERQALIDEKIRQNNERFVTTLRDARGQVDPAKALVYLLENHGQVDLPVGMTSVAAEQKAVEAMAKASMEEVLHTFRPQLLTGKTRETARLRNVVAELAGEGKGDVAAKALAQAWIRTSERLRQEFNAAGGDIPKLEGWFLPQVHDRGALLAAGRAKWVADIYKQLDLDRIVDGETRKPLSPAEIRQALSDIWENITSDGHGTQAANASDPFGGVTGDPTGAKKLANQRQEHRFLHFKSADDWLNYQKQYGGGNDPFRAMMQHITSISKDIAAMRVLGTNPNRELARLAKFATKQAKLARPAAVLIDEAVSKIKDLTAAYLKTPTRLDEVSDRIGAIHKEIARLREKRFGPPSRRNKKKIEALRTELFALDAERIWILDRGSPRIDGLEGAQLRQDLEAAYDELAAVQDVDKVLFPKKTEMLGKTMTQSGFWTTAPEDYARSYISRAEAMWDIYRGVTSAPVNAKAASVMQMLRNVGVVGRGGSMVISSIADNFTQVMARRFTGLPAHKTFTDILQQLGPNAHREAQRQALIGETYLHMFNDGARGAASLQGPEWSHVLAERTIALQGLGALTDAQRQAFGMSLQAAIADLAVKSWADVGALNPRLQKLFQRYGLGEAEWDAIRLDPATGQVRDVDFLSPNLVRDGLEAAGRGNERVAERYLGMILQETDFASPTSMLRARAAMVGKTRPGTLVGEFLRTAGQFKQFSFMFGMLHFERALREGIANGTLKGASYAAQTLLVMTLGGALVVQLKDLKGGKDTRPMDKPGFWGAALMQGGGLGIIGDIFNSEQNRFGGGLVSTFAGPVFGLGEDILGAAGISPKTTAARGSARLATSYVPGSSLWYLNLAYQRTVSDTLQRYVDPKAYDAFRRRQTQQLKDYGNGFWWAPGQTAPARVPRLN